MNKNVNIINMIKQELDYINVKRFDYSLKKLTERYPDGAPIHVIANALNMSEDECNQMYADVVQKIKNKMGVPNE